MSAYKPVPVAAAEYVAHHCEKDVVVIISVDNSHELTHCTTFGKSPSDKVLAADWGDFLMAQLSGTDAPRRTFEDFRLNAATIKAERDELLAAARKVYADLNARIDAAPDDAKPVFGGIADLHDAINKATKGTA